MSSSGADDVLKHDWYRIVDCPMDASRETIGKAIRKLSLLYHPDKDKSSKAAEMFLLIQKAKDVLLDDATRATYDTAFRSVKKRKEHDDMRKTQMDASKKRLREELEERMRKVSHPPAQGHGGVEGKSYSASGTFKKAREDRDERIRQLRQQNLGAVHAHGDEAARHEISMQEQILREQSVVKARADAAKLRANACSIKVRWRRNDESHSEDSLLHAFRQFGGIEAIIINADKGTSAVLIFSDEASVQKAVDAHADATTFKVSRLDEPRRADIFTHVYAKADSSVPTVFRTDGSIKTGSHQDDSTTFKVPEDSILLSHMRRAVEKEELMRTLQQPGNGPGAPATSSESNPPHPSTAPTPASVFSFSRGPDTATAAKGNLASRESDVLRKMLETAALLKKAKDTTVPSV
jgi:curved DNA-binding protein CbpA